MAVARSQLDLRALGLWHAFFIWLYASEPLRTSGRSRFAVTEVGSHAVLQHAGVALLPRLQRRPGASMLVRAFDVSTIRTMAFREVSYLQVFAYWSAFSSWLAGQLGGRPPLRPPLAAFALGLRRAATRRCSTGSFCS